MKSGVSDRWLWALLINVALAQASIYVMRPMITYRAIENGASSFEIGVIASIYALLPLLVAVPMGRWVGRLGEIPLLVAGSLSFIALGIAFSFLNNVIAIALATAVAGVAHRSGVPQQCHQVFAGLAHHHRRASFDGGLFGLGRGQRRRFARPAERGTGALQHAPSGPGHRWQLARRAGRERRGYARRTIFAADHGHRPRLSAPRA